MTFVHRLLQRRETAVLRDSLAPYRGELLDGLWRAVAQPPRGREQQRLRAAYALAAYDPDSPRWRNAGAAVAGDLVAVPAVHLADWMAALRPARGQLLRPLSTIFHDGRRRETERSAMITVGGHPLAAEIRVANHAGGKIGFRFTMLPYALELSLLKKGNKAG